MKTRKDYLGLSTDEKPKSVNGSTFYEVDSKKEFINYKNTWYEQQKTGRGSDLTEYFNMTPTAEEFNKTSGWVYQNFIKKTPDLIIPDNVQSLSGLCSGLGFAPKIICNNNITIMDSLYNTNSASSIDISGLNTSNVTKINSMFSGCQNIMEMDLSNLNFNSISSTATHRNNVFTSCYKLEKVVVPRTFNRSLRQWFNGCYSLKTLVILNENNVVTYDLTFLNCYHMDGTVNETYNPQGLKDGKIYVPDNLVESYKTASGWSTYAQQILPLSQYE